MSEIDWKAEARKWESRAKANRAEALRLSSELDAAKEQSRAWRSSFHSLRLSVEDRLDQILEEL